MQITTLLRSWLTPTRWALQSWSEGDMLNLFHCTRDKRACEQHWENNLAAHISTPKKWLPELKSWQRRNLSLKSLFSPFVAETYPRVSGTHEIPGNSREQQAVFWRQHPQCVSGFLCLPASWSEDCPRNQPSSSGNPGEPCRQPLQNKGKYWLTEVERNPL